MQKSTKGTYEFDKFHTIIIGSGAAGLNCALELLKRKVPANKIAIISEKVGGGTSFNAGSDKQTYYHVSINGDQPDSPVAMAHTLYDGGSMHGDIALIESTCSIQAFLNLVNLGVPFPHDKYGAYVGYKTDNDNLQRGTSAGPLTSYMMGTCLLEEVKSHGVKVFDQHTALRLVKDDSGQCCGVIAINNSTWYRTNLKQILASSPDLKDLREKLLKTLISFQSEFVVLACGGPSGMYKNSVYPESQFGATSLAIMAGAKLQNVTESQFGLASLKFRWNVSGSYQQVIPRYISLSNDEALDGEFDKGIEFLNDYFPDTQSMLNAIFLKGYQWPFNPQRIKDNGSSLIDMAVHIETVDWGRKVFLDFRRNPEGFNWEMLNPEAKQYLEKSNANQSTPIERLSALNPKAIGLYKEHGIDLLTEPLEIGMCVQHSNGGVVGDIWWQTTVPRLFAVGEINGSHGVHRPGGSALNAGQVGGIRAAEKICYGKWPVEAESVSLLENFSRKSTETKEIITREWIQLIQNYISNIDPKTGQISNMVSLNEILNKLQTRMSKYGAYIRNHDDVSDAFDACDDDLRSFFSSTYISSGDELIFAWKVYDALLTQFMYLAGMTSYLVNEGGSRGCFTVIEPKINEKSVIGIKNLEKYPIKPRNYDFDDKILEVQLRTGPTFNALNEKFDLNLEWVMRRPIPKDSTWFENTWKEFESRKLFQ